MMINSAVRSQTNCHFSAARETRVCGIPGATLSEQVYSIGSDTFIHVSGTSASCRVAEVVYYYVDVYHNVLIPGSEGNV